jgi:hypothetical protein
MGRSSKGFSLLLVVILSLSSMLMVESASAQTIPKPSAPVTKVQFVNHSYYVSPKTTTLTNPYTGEPVVTTSEGYYIQNDTFVIKLTGQPLANNVEVNGHGLSLYFVVGSKGHYASQWENLSSHYSVPVQGFIGSYSKWLLSGDNATYPTDDNGYTIAGFDGFIGGQYGGQVDFRACTVIGYTLTVLETPNPFNIRNPYSTEFVVVQESDWSPTQTIRISANSVSPNPTLSPTNGLSPTPTLSVPEFSLLAILPLFVVVLFIAVKIRQRKTQAT